MFMNPPNSTKKTFYYNFFPTKEEEESSKARNFEWGQAGVGRVMVEIRDIHPPPVVDPKNPWRIHKTLNQYEIDSGKLVLSWHDTFEHVLRYWSIGMANSIDLGLKVDVAMWDVTQENYPRIYDQFHGAYLQMGERDDFYLACMALMKDRNLKVYDEISLYWDSNKSRFMFKLLL